MGTIQLDFQLPRRFECTYRGADGGDHTPVVIHRVIYGSFERFVGILIEHFEGRFPLWIAPVQVEVVPVQDDSPELGKAMAALVERLRKQKIRARVHSAYGERMQARIRDCEQRKVPYVVVMGKRDLERGDDTLTVRDTRTREQTTIAVDEWITLLRGEISEKRLVVTGAPA